jgi:alanyl-tRNA synthetase
MTQEQIEQVEAIVNRSILENYPLQVSLKNREQAMAEGAMALFGEKYGETVRTITIGDTDPISYELCGGTHVSETNDIGLFLITSEGSAAAGVRRIEAVTGRTAYDLVQKRSRTLKQASQMLTSAPEDVPNKIAQLQNEVEQLRKRLAAQRQEMAAAQFSTRLGEVHMVSGIPVMTALMPDADADALRAMTDSFRQKHPSGVIVVASAVDDRPVIIAAVTEDLVKRGLHAGELVKAAAQIVGGGGGGRPTLAQAGGKDIAKLPEALAKVEEFVLSKLK